MKNFIRNIWDKIVAWLLGIPTDKKMHFVAGLIIAAFFCITLHMKFCFWPIIFIAAGKEFFDLWTTDEWEWWDFGATCFGGLLIQLFVILG